MGRLAEVIGVRFGKKSTAPGNAVLLKTKAGGNVIRETELYHPPGIASAPTEEDQVIELELKPGGRVVLVTHNYKVNIEVSAGETIVYSTDANGGTVKAQVALDNNGNVSINGDSKRLVTYAELNTALQGLITAINAEFATKYSAAGAPGTLTLDISAAETQTVKTGG